MDFLKRNTVSSATLEPIRSRRQQQNTNFSCYFICVDRLFGTYSEGDVRDVRAAGAGSGKRLSFMQQLLFPFRKADKFEAPLPWERPRDEGNPAGV